MIINVDNPSSYSYPSTPTFIYKKGALLKYLPNLLPSTRPFYRWHFPVAIEKLDLTLWEHRNCFSSGINKAVWPTEASVFLYLGGKPWEAQVNNTVIHFFIMSAGKDKNIPLIPLLEKPVVVFHLNDGWSLPFLVSLKEYNKEKEEAKKVLAVSKISGANK